MIGGDRPATQRGAANESGAEITAEMVEAGVRILLESGYLRYEFEGGVRLLIRDILSACLSAPKRH
jgi:hypothetical protein